MRDRLPGDVSALRARMTRLWSEIRGDVTENAATCAARTSHLAGAATSVIIAIGGTQQVQVPWPGDGFPTDVYDVDVVLMGLLGKGTAAVVAQTSGAVTVEVTAALLIAAGTQFLVFGRTRSTAVAAAVR